MAPELTPPPLAGQTWFREFLENRGFQTTAAHTFINGRSTIRLEGSVLYAIPGGGGKPWRTETKAVPPEIIRQLLTGVLAGPFFASQQEIDDQMSRRNSAESALQAIAESIRDKPDTHCAKQLGRLLWSMFNGHHTLNLWSIKNCLDSHHIELVSEMVAAWLRGDLPDEALRKALVASGEMDRPE